MPIFEYECERCSERFEELMGRSDPDPACPSCGGSEVHRLISQTTFKLKGSGWYATDYSTSSSANGKKGTSAGSAEAKKEAGSGGGGGEAAAA